MIMIIPGIMRKIWFIGIALFHCYFILAQTVENIRVEPEGEVIRITYRIGGSLEDDLYNISLECSIDGGPRFEPRSALGDVGDNIRGGKSYYTIEWEVFKDLDEIGEAEFFISLDRVDKEIPVSIPAVRRNIFTGYSGSVGAPVGVSGGYLGNWGFYASFRAGFQGHVTITGGLTKQVFQKDTYRMHAYAGLGRGDYLDEFTVEAGIVNVVFNRINLNLGIAVPRYYADLTFGVGIVF
jgi:hypothetical protein